MEECSNCGDTGMVCENHPDTPWDWADLAPYLWSLMDCAHNCGAGMPCPVCCSPIPEDGSTSIAMAFVPDKFRHAGP